VYGGDRSGEWEIKLKGASYEEVAKAGGGIVNTVKGTRAATVDELVEMARPRVQALLREGITAMEIKSGYGLEETAERRMLQAAREIGRRFNIKVCATFLGAHAVPTEFKDRADAYVEDVLRMMRVLKDEGLVDAVDCFTESIAFSVAQTQRIFDEAKRLELPIRLHGDQLNDLGGAALAAKYGALSCDHCEKTSEEGVKAMAASGTIAVLLPVSNYFIKDKARPPVQSFRAAGVPMALATNCNPGSSPCTSILLCLNMGCTVFGLTPEEALLGVTRHAASAMGLGETHGVLEVGKAGDLNVWDVRNPCELAYYLGLNKLVACYRAGRLRSTA
jgi:imidazolonepropionase